MNRVIKIYNFKTTAEDFDFYRILNENRGKDFILIQSNDLSHFVLAVSTAVLSHPAVVDNAEILREPIELSSRSKNPIWGFAGGVELVKRDVAASKTVYRVDLDSVMQEYGFRLRIFDKEDTEQVLNEIQHVRNLIESWGKVNKQSKPAKVKKDNRLNFVVKTI